MAQRAMVWGAMKKHSSCHVLQRPGAKKQHH
jgi:hypothetical protein